MNRSSIEGIPIRVEAAPKSARIHLYRRLSQYLVLILLVAIPLSGLFRIDPVMGAFVMLDYQIWFSDILIVMGFWIFAVSLLVVFYSLAGSVFCGWMCPQNTVSEWANQITARLLGRKAQSADFSGQQLRIAARRGGWLNLSVLFLALLAASMLYALIPLLYFYSPSAIWAFLTFQDDARLAPSLHWIYFVCVSIMFLDIAVIRHLLCKYMCIYRVWQHSFKTRDTLKVVYDASRSEDCRHCHYCVDACFLDIDPRKTEVFDSCVNCGECIVACDRLHARSRKLHGPGLLRFAIGASSRRSGETVLGSILQRARVALVVTVLSALVLAVGIANYQPHAFTVDRMESEMADAHAFRINIANKRYRPVSFVIDVRGLPEGSFVLERKQVDFASVGRKDVALRIRAGHLPRGVHRFHVVVRANDGWNKRFSVQYFSDGGGES